MANPLLALSNRVATLERRVTFGARHAPVAQVDAAKGLVRLDLGEGDAGRLLSPWIPYAQIAGALKVHTPPSVGQQMTYLAPGGDTEQAIALPMTWSNQNESPSQSGAENVVTFGDVRITLTETAVRIEVGGFVLQVSGEGLAMAGGGVGHNGQDIASPHRHREVWPGPAQPAPRVAAGPTP